MDHLWSPWRYRYIAAASDKDECIFCVKAAEHRDEENLIVYRGERAFILLNLFPYTSGHLMIAPYRHVAALSETPPETAREIFDLTRTAEGHLRSIYKPDGLNLGMNIGASAGAGIAGHIHMHVLPRWTGDANFMSTIGETRVMPEELPETWAKLRAKFQGK